MNRETRTDSIQEARQERWTARCASVLRRVLGSPSAAPLVSTPTSCPNSNNDSSVDAPLLVDERYVLIDDDFLIRMGWMTEAEEKKVQLDTYESSAAFLQNLSQYTKTTKIYIDVSLGDGLESGEALAQKLHALGYQEIYLATGYGKECFDHLPWIKGIQGKTPPF